MDISEASTMLNQSSEDMLVEMRKQVLEMRSAGNVIVTNKPVVPAPEHGIKEILKERHVRHGKFTVNAKYAQTLKDELHLMNNWSKLDNDQKEALDNIMQKVARLMNGDHNDLDHWTDIVGYGTLIMNRLEGK